MRASLSLSSILGVVPLDTSEWNPEIAPQAIVMKQNGKSLPAKTGPVPSTNFVTAGMWSWGSVRTIPTASAATVPILMKVER